MAGVNLQLRHGYSIAQFVPTVSSPSPPPQRIRLGISPSRVLCCNLRANIAAASNLRTTRRSDTVSVSSAVDSPPSSDSFAEDRDEVGRIPLLEVRDLRAVIVESRQEILKGVNLVMYEGEVRNRHY